MATTARVQSPQNQTGNVVRDSSLALVPETLDPYLALNKSIWESGPLSAAEVEMVRLRNARKVNCVFCRSARYDIATQAGLTEEKVSHIDDEYQNSDLSAREKMIIEYTDQYLNDPAAISEEFQQRLLKEFSVAEIVHLSLCAAHFHGFSRCAVALGGMPDELPIMQVSVPE